MGRLIAVVDDDLSMRRALRRVMQVAGFVVETFASAVEFLESSRSDRTACLVLDVHLGGMSGLDLQQRLATDQAGIPIVFITACDEPSTRERARQSGAAGYLCKPVGKETLLDAVIRAISREDPRMAWA